MMIGHAVYFLPAFFFHVSVVVVAAFLLGLYVRRRVVVVSSAFLAGSLAFFCFRHVGLDFSYSWRDFFWEPVFRGGLLRHFPNAEANIGFVTHWLIPLGLAYWIAGRARSDYQRMHQMPDGAGDPEVGGEDMNDETLLLESRWKRRLCSTVAITVGFLLFYPSLTYACSFPEDGFLVIAIPVSWGVFALITYRDRKEQVVGWLAVGLAMFSVWKGFESNAALAFR